MPKTRLELLDYLRFAAAASVVCFHYLFNGMENGKLTSLLPSPAADLARFGFFGVELFFMISGFVIMESARGKTARQFVVSRAVRLLPAFWMAMVLTATVTVLWGDASGLHLSVGQVLGNVTMTPQLFGVDPVDGVYWTLALELQFYLLVFLFLLTGRGEAVSTFLPYWALAILLVQKLVPPLATTVWLWDDFAFFVAGALIADVWHSGLSRMRLLGLLASAAVTLPYAAWLGSELMPDRRWAAQACMLLVVAFYAVLLSLRSPAVSRLSLPGSRLAGGLTYPVYLLHAHIGYILLSRFASEANKWAAYAAVLSLVLALALVVHLGVERKLAHFWRLLFDGSLGRLTGYLDRSVFGRGRVEEARATVLPSATESATS